MEDHEDLFENLVSVVFVSENMLIKEKFQELERLLGKTMTNYQVGDFLIRVKNAANAGLKTVEMQKTSYIKAVAEALKVAGFLSEVQEKDGILISALTMKNKKPVLADLKVISKPGLRVYADTKILEKRRGPSILILSTPKGIVSSKEALKNRIGGEVIVEVW